FRPLPLVIAARARAAIASPSAAGRLAACAEAARAYSCPMILGASKEDLEARLGRGVMGRALLDMPGERAWAWRVGDFDLVVSFLDGMARAMAVKRRGGPMAPLSPSELSAILALNGPAALWSVHNEAPEPPAPARGAKARPSRTLNAKGPDRHFTLVEKDPKAKDRVHREIFGFSPGGAPFAFFYLPVAGGAPPVLPSEAAIIGKLR
ncbi:MAG: hypothetical protein N2322_05785, partial [Terrimicrobiaceae bacterium]|nr:hypothetical protein [Terrimicrobiaceae bacterium]